MGLARLLLHTLAAGVPVAARPAGVPLLAKFGALMFAAGFAVETVADLQKWAFKNDAANAGKCCSVGLWKMSQHPNWAGNLLLWSGILVINAPTLLAAVRRAARRAHRPLPPLLLPPLPRGRLHRRRRRATDAVGDSVGGAAGSAAGPAFLGALYGQGSGAVSNTVELAGSKYQVDSGYAAYVETTPLVVPTLKSIAAALPKSLPWDQ